MSVMRGQMKNLLTALLDDDSTPAELAGMRKMVIKRKKSRRKSFMASFSRHTSKNSHIASERSELHERESGAVEFEISYPDKEPCFKRC